jgi:hypothetical protein
MNHTSRSCIKTYQQVARLRLWMKLQVDWFDFSENMQEHELKAFSLLLLSLIRIALT